VRRVHPGDGTGLDDKRWYPFYIFSSNHLDKS
jgi:hypothetical protein